MENTAIFSMFGMEFKGTGFGIDSGIGITEGGEIVAMANINDVFASVFLGFNHVIDGCEYISLTDCGTEWFSGTGEAGGAVKELTGIIEDHLEMHGEKIAKDIVEHIRLNAAPAFDEASIAAALNQMPALELLDADRRQEFASNIWLSTSINTEMDDDEVAEAVKRVDALHDLYDGAKSIARSIVERIFDDLATANRDQIAVFIKRAKKAA